MGDELQQHVPAPELIAPVVDHTEKITRLEEKQTQYEEAIQRRIADLESQLRQAIEEGGRGAQERINSLEERINALLDKLEQASTPEPEPEPEQGLEFNAPPIVEESPAPPEKVLKGRRAKRRDRFNKRQEKRREGK